MAAKQPIKVYMHKGGGPNPWKAVIMILELGLPYETETIENPKSAEYLKVNPNGRLPAITDPNTGVTVWESGAILQYLAETYDGEARKISYGSSPQKWEVAEFLHFQMSGQGPYFGQFAWFSLFHAEKLPSAIERYRNEVKRVTGVLELALSGNDSGKKNKQWLAGDKFTYADLAFVPWFWIMAKMPDLWTELESDNPHWAAWIKRVNERAAVKKAAELKAAWQ